MAYSVYSASGIRKYWLLNVFVEYVLTISILLSSKYSLCEFLVDLLSSCKPARLIKDDKWRIIRLIMIFPCSVHVISVVVYNMYFENYSSFIYMIWLKIMEIPFFGCEVISVANFVLFYCFYGRMKILREEFEHEDINLEQLQTDYKAMADIFERLRKNYDGLFIIEFMSNSPKWIIIILNHLTLMKLSTPWLMTVCSYIWTFQITVQICVPAVFAEMTNAQIEEIQVILHERLLVETDESQAVRMARLLDYTRARPLMRKAWRLVPLDLQLPVTMLSLCATYLIVIVQYIHLYD